MTMFRNLCAAVMLTLPLVLVIADEKTDKAKSRPPNQGVAGIEKDGRLLVVRQDIVTYRTEIRVQVVVKNGMETTEQMQMNVPLHKVVHFRFALKDVQVFDSKGKKISAQDAGRLF